MIWEVRWRCLCYFQGIRAKHPRLRLLSKYPAAQQFYFFGLFFGEATHATCSANKYCHEFMTVSGVCWTNMEHESRSVSANWGCIFAFSTFYLCSICSTIQQKFAKMLLGWEGCFFSGTTPLSCRSKAYKEAQVPVLFSLFWGQMAMAQNRTLSNPCLLRYLLPTFFWGAPPCFGTCVLDHLEHSFLWFPLVSWFPWLPGVRWFPFFPWFPWFLRCPLVSLVSMVSLVSFGFLSSVVLVTLCYSSVWFSEFVAGVRCALQSPAIIHVENCQCFLLPALPVVYYLKKCFMLQP